MELSLIIGYHYILTSKNAIFQQLKPITIMVNVGTEIFDRQKAIDKANAESELSDYKQHAMKMLRDFEKFNDFSSNRAIWELVQNACDLTTQCEIVVDYTDHQFSFTHNGRPFTSNALISLIKQISGDKGR